MKPYPILVFGSANADHVFRTPRLPSPGETVLGTGFEILAGGKGANQAVAAGRLGADVGFVGCMGEDADGDLLTKSLTSANVSLSYSERVETPTGAAGIFVDDHGTNIIAVAPGANALVSVELVHSALIGFRPEIVLCQLEIPMEAVMAATHALKFILNPAPARKLPPEILSKCFAITPNETELEFLTGIAPVDRANAEKSAQILLDQGVENVIVTLGEQGSLWVSKSGARHFPAPQVKAIDTTGAGDVFNGALITFLAEDRDMAQAITLANKAAALSTTRSGAQSSAPWRKELLI